MIHDLADTEASSTRRLTADVCIVGAGIAGLLLADRLCRRGLGVVVLESGGRNDDGSDHPLNRVVNRGRPYDGAVRGRARSLGGTSTRWGGAMIPFLPSDLAARPHVGIEAWPVQMSELEPYFAAVETFFQVQHDSYGPDFLRAAGRNAMAPPVDGDFEARFAKWPTFRRRNVATLLKDTLSSPSGPAVWLNATACAFAVDATAGRLQSITAGHHGDRRLEVSARQFVLCAGAIESTRLLLLLDRQHGSHIFAGNEAIGRYFHDHVSMPAARLVPRQLRGLNRLAGFRFVGETMRSLRFELSPAAQSQDAVSSAFGHINFTTDGNSGFDALRDFLRALQKDGRIDLGRGLQVLRDVPYLVSAGYWSVIHQQLLWPSPAACELHVVAEQLPRATNRIELVNETDWFGCPLAAIDWRVDAQELSTIVAFAARFDAYWKRHRLTDLAEIDWRIDRHGGSITAPEALGDIFHPGGTTRMGTYGRTSVVGSDLSVFAVPNLSVASTSAFPSGASANPTLMLMAFALRLADHLGNRMASG